MLLKLRPDGLEVRRIWLVDHKFKSKSKITRKNEENVIQIDEIKKSGSTIAREEELTMDLFVVFLAQQIENYDFFTAEYQQGMIQRSPYKKESDVTESEKGVQIEANKSQSPRTSEHSGTRKKKNSKRNRKRNRGMVANTFLGDFDTVEPKGDRVPEGFD